MIEKDCGAVPVTDEEGRPIGIITDRDIVTRTLGGDKDPNTASVQDCMSGRCLTVQHGASIDECCKVMEQNQIRRVVVVDESGKCRGIVSQADIAEHASMRKTGEVVREVSHSERIARAAGRAIWTGTTKTAVTIGSVAAAAFIGGLSMARQGRGFAGRLGLNKASLAHRFGLDKVARAASA
jgi:CBS domain containing-hemolysin-like protein